MIFLTTIIKKQPKIIYRLTFSYLFVISSFVSAEDYFDPGFLTLSGESNNIDLSIFSNKNSVAEGEYTLTVFLNNQDVGQYSLTFLKNRKDIVTPELTTKLLKSWGVDVNNISSLSSLPNDKAINELDSYIPHATINLDLARLRLDISIPQVAMDPSFDKNSDPNLWDNGIPAILMNYNISAGHSDNDNSVKNDNLYASIRSGVNISAWRLRSTMTYTRSKTSESNNELNSLQQQTQFSDTYIARDINNIRSSLLVGESTTGSDVFDSIPFKGIKLASNEQMLPSQLRGYAPSITGIANTNARITVRQNGNVVYETYVAPGPFNINDIQQAGLSGDYDVTVTESDGSERRFIIPYSALPMMLRPKGSKYELTMGRYNGSLTQGSRESDFILGTAAYGLPSGITVYGGTILSKNYQSYNLGTGVSLGQVGALSGDITHSSTKLINNNSESNSKVGQSYRVRYSKSLDTTGTSVDLTALRYSTENFYNFNEFNSQGYQLGNGVNPWILQHRRSSFQTQLSQQLAEYGSLRFRASKDDFWGSNKTLKGLSLGYSGTAKGVSFGLNYSIDRVKDTNGHWPENRQISANISIPFRNFSFSQNTSIYATSMYMQDNHGKTQNQVGVSGSMLDSSISYSLSQNWGNQGQVATSNANVAYQGSKGSISSGYSYSNDSRSINMNTNGGILIHSDGITLSTSMGDSVALISAPGAYGASLNNGATIIDQQGYAVAPYLTDYTKNSIGIDPTTLPDNVDLIHSNVNIYPTKGAVVKANLKTRIGYQALITIINKNQTVIPFGTIASLQRTNNESITGIVGDQGQVYLSGLPEKGSLHLHWGNSPDEQCTANFNINDSIVNKFNLIHQINSVCENKK
ncbi:fimbrial biogenesis outer membrane usher protein (plasmid) [Providencia rettgeri]|uniref:fimbria/pilus outer membrane usher protein n=1 Tax=Providencia rettgeri TaxID=587 RepID=UPI001E56D1F0|nr:fimbria/pilus outer membrane usher protein [Providencia rettgeri]UEK61560.1 fimbrial biogenesis outer membrane usher protein [Providencia rettgeri]